MNDSRLTRAERAHGEAQTRREEARARHGKVAAELEAAEHLWAAATLDSMTLDDFARLGAQVELLRRAVAPLRRKLDAAEDSYQAAAGNLATVRQSLFAAQDRLDRALYQGNLAAERDARRQLATLTGEG